MSPDESMCTFSSLFGQLKRLRCRQPSDDHVIDVRSQRDESLIERLEGEVDHHVLDERDCGEVALSFTDPSTWRPVYIKSLGRGVVVVPGVINQEYCKIWFDRLLHEYPQTGKGFRSNLDLQCLPTGRSERLLSNLRWLTFGYHYDWSSKVYDFDRPDRVPNDLETMFAALARILRIDFRPEAGIINYYTCKSRICSHVDVAERSTAPLFSLSLGSSAILMVGGVQKQDVPVCPILLNDGDLIIMQDTASSKKRLAWHAVPKIYCPQYQNECSTGIVRININTRQVF